MSMRGVHDKYTHVTMSTLVVSVLLTMFVSCHTLNDDSDSYVRYVSYEGLLKHRIFLIFFKMYALFNCIR